MAKEKKQKQINLEEITALTKELFHAHYAGDLERWFDYLCPDSIYLGTGEPMLFGGSAIREHFKDFEGRAVDVVSEEYYPVPLGETAAQVCGQIAVRSRHPHQTCTKQAKKHSFHLIEIRRFRRPELRVRHLQGSLDFSTSYE